MDERDLSRSNLEPGTELLGRYRIERRLGGGGAGFVYKAFDQARGESVALKLLTLAALANRTAVARFKREFDAMRALSHPNIVQAYELHEAAFESGGSDHLLAMEYVEGTALTNRIYFTPRLTIPEAVKILRDIACGLRYAHAQGLIHRDLKPDNVLLSCTGTAKLADFGLARPIHDELHLTATNETVGTPYYMAPEQLRADGVDVRTDIYALGILAYELFVGARPFQSTSLMQLAAQHMREELPSVRKQRPELPGWIETFILGCAEKQPAHRYQSMDEVLELLEAKLRRIERRERKGRFLDRIAAFCRGGSRRT